MWFKEGYKNCCNSTLGGLFTPSWGLCGGLCTFLLFHKSYSHTLTTYFTFINPIRLTGKPDCSPWGHKESDTIDWLNWIDSLTTVSPCFHFPVFHSLVPWTRTRIPISLWLRDAHSVLQVISAITQPCGVIVYRTEEGGTWEHGVREPEWPYLVNLLTHINISTIGNCNLGYWP